MVAVDDDAPDFTLPKATGAAYNDFEAFTLSDAFGEGPIVLAFYPAAFTSACTEEMCAFRDAKDASTNSTRRCTASASTSRSRRTSGCNRRS